MTAFRIYIFPNCPHCKRVAWELFVKDIPFEAVEIANDPIIETGIRVCFQTEEVKAPVLVPLWGGDKQVVLGANLDAVQRAISRYLGSNGAGAVDLPADRSQDIRPDTQAAVQA